MSYAFNADPLTISFSPCTRNPLGWLQETRLAARRIADITTKPIWLCLSGGIDSESMGEAFLSEKIPFNVLIFAHHNSKGVALNEHDIKFAKDWCKNRGINPLIVPHNLEKLIITEAPNYFAPDGYITGNVFRYLQIKLLRQVEAMGGYGVLGGGELLFYVDDKPSLTTDDIYLNFDSGFAVPLDWCQRNQVSHEPYFFFSTPEVIRSWLEVPFIKFSLAHPEIYRHSSNKFDMKIISIRTFYYQAPWRNKFNGFEQVRGIRLKSEDRLKSFFGSKIQALRLPVTQLLAALGN